MADDRLRIDKWLWFARLAKTRTVAQKLAVSGRVRINRQKNDSAAHPVKIGDVLTVALESGVRILKITAMATRRGPAAEARLLYEDLSPPPVPVERPVSRPAGAGRPTKQDRRALEKFRRELPGHGEDFPSDER